MFYFYYLFQICHVALQVEEFDRRNVQLDPDSMEMLSDIELTQYFIQSWSLNYHDPGYLPPMIYTSQVT